MQDPLDEATLDSSYGRFLGIPRPSLRRKVYLESSYCDQLEQTVDYSNDHRPPTHTGFASSLIGTQTQCLGFLNCYLELKSAIVIGVQRGIGEHQQLSREISYFYAKQCHWLGESLPQEGPLIHHCRSQLSVDRDFHRQPGHLLFGHTICSELLPIGGASVSTFVVCFSGWQIEDGIGFDSVRGVNPLEVEGFGKLDGGESPVSHHQSPWAEGASE